MAIDTPADSRSTTTTRPAADPENSERLSLRAKLVLFVLCAAQFVVALDFSILNIALPSLGESLHLSQANLQWGMTAFALPSGGFLLLFGRIADAVGRKRVFLGGLMLFTAASVLATLAWSPGSFLAVRALQGVGAAAIVPAGMALLTTTFREGPQRDRALGVMGSLMAVGFTCGMVLGGVLTQLLTWRSTMALNVVMGAAVLLAAPRLLPESRNSVRPRMDVPGAITVTGGLLSLIYALSTAAQHGFGDTSVIVTLIAAAILLTGFVAIESRTTEPLISLRILRRPTVAFGNLGGLTTIATMTAAVFLGTLYLQQVNHLSPVLTGLVFGALGVTCAVTGTLAPGWVSRVGSAKVLAGGLLAQAALTFGLLAIGAGTGGTWLFLVVISVAGIGHMAAMVAYNVTATSGLPNDEQGQATGLTTTTQQVGITVGIPLLSALAATRSEVLSGVKLGLAADAIALAVLAMTVAVGLGATARRR